MFSSVQRVRSFEGIVQQIRDVILRGEVQPGSRLPAERDLAQQLGVSRTTLREALRALESIGLIKIKLGSAGGIFAAVPDGQMVGVALDAMMHLRHASRWEMHEYRTDFEPRNASMAATRASEADIDRIERSIDAFEASVRRGTPYEQVRSKCDVHEAIASGTHNEVRASMMVALCQAISRDAQERPSALSRVALDQAVTGFRELVEHIREGDAASAEMVMRRRLIWI